VNTIPTVVPASAPQPSDVPWPSDEWPRATASATLTDMVDRAFRDSSLATTNAVVVIHGGRLVLERYAGAKEHFDREPETIEAATPLISWSMAKSMLHFLVGVLVGEGHLDPAAPARIAAWRDDERRDITLGQLLAMRDGLDYVEDYVDGDSSDVIEMLFGSGRPDVAGFTIAKPLAHPPGSFFNYSSGTTNIISKIVADDVGAGDDYRTFIDERLFGPLGMRSAEATFDDAGTFIASSFVHATAADFARFGLLYLRGGRWGDQQLVSPEWINTAQVPLSREEESGNFYSWQWWVTGDEFGTYWASGYDGQMIAISPALDVVVVRLGRTPADRYADLRAWRHDVMATFA
jgi:CubicO group peptidase (beta-lactamase class C family)